MGRSSIRQSPISERKYSVARAGQETGARPHRIEIAHQVGQLAAAEIALERLELTRRPQRSDERAHAGAGDRVDCDARLGQAEQHTRVRDPARTTRAERQSQSFALSARSSHSQSHPDFQSNFVCG